MSCSSKEKDVVRRGFSILPGRFSHHVSYQLLQRSKQSSNSLLGYPTKLVFIILYSLYQVVPNIKIKAPFISSYLGNRKQ